MGPDPRSGARAPKKTEAPVLITINGLHHITSVASDARTNHRFFTETLGLRRVKTTVNFDVPDVYCIYDGDTRGTPGSAMRYFPFPHAARGRPGAGEVGETRFAIPDGAARFWADRLGAGPTETPFGERSVMFSGPDGDAFDRIDDPADTRAPWSQFPVPVDPAIRGVPSGHIADPRCHRLEGIAVLHGLRNGREPSQPHPHVPPRRYRASDRHRYLPGRAGPRIPAWARSPNIAFSVDTRADQLAARRALADRGHRVTPIIDRDYFWAIYFRTPDGIPFAIATNAPGIDRDEDPECLGRDLKLPAQHEHLREILERSLQGID